MLSSNQGRAWRTVKARPTNMRFYLTTAIDYVNSRPHLGTAYEKITADVIARYKRLSGFETHFLMGNDEHSQNVYKRALERGLDPRVYCDQMEQEFRSVWKQLDISFDDFIRYRGESGARDAGRLRLEGKEYLVQEGDVLHFRFNV